MSCNGGQILPGGVTIKPEPVSPNVKPPLVIKQEPCDDDWPRSAGLKRKASAGPSAPPKWNHDTSDLSRVMSNIKTEPGLDYDSPTSKKPRIDHNRNYARCKSPEPGVEVITGNRKFANEVYIGRFPCPVDRWEIAHFARYLGYPIWPRDVRCWGQGQTYGFIMMRNSRDVHAICSGGPYLFNGRMVRVEISAKGKAARGLRDHRSVKWFHGK